MEYTILSSRNEENLIILVNEHIAKGWVPQGGVCLALDHYAYFYQAMIKISK
jgi:hypothetical protein